MLRARCRTGRWDRPVGRDCGTGPRDGTICCPVGGITRSPPGRDTDPTGRPAIRPNGTDHRSAEQLSHITDTGDAPGEGDRKTIDRTATERHPPQAAGPPVTEGAGDRRTGPQATGHRATGPPSDRATEGPNHRAGRRSTGEPPDHQPWRSSRQHATSPPRGAAAIFSPRPPRSSIATASPRPLFTGQNLCRGRQTARPLLSFSPFQARIRRNRPRDGEEEIKGRGAWPPTSDQPAVA